MSEHTKEPPDVIWLQWGNDPVGSDYHDTTWCRDKIHDDDVRYVHLAAIADPAAFVTAADGVLDWYNSFPRERNSEPIALFNQICDDMALLAVRLADLDAARTGEQGAGE